MLLYGALLVTVSRSYRFSAHILLTSTQNVPIVQILLYTHFNRLVEKVPDTYIILPARNRVMNLKIRELFS